MFGGPKVRSMNVADPEARPVLVPAGNKTSSVVTRKPSSKPMRKVEKLPEGVVAAGAVVEEEKKKTKLRSSTAAASSPLSSSLSSPPILQRQEFLLHSNLSLNVSCMSDASTDSFQSRASTGRIGRGSLTGRRRLPVAKLERTVMRMEKLVPDGLSAPSADFLSGKKRCAWVTPNTDPNYVTFHDEEWGLPVHNDRKLFELLVLSGALSELTWPTILSKRHIFREVFMDFDIVSVAKLNEKKIMVLGSPAGSLLSEPKLRAIIENACQILKIIEEFGSFDRYCWSFVNHRPVLSRFRYPRQVPVKTPKADVISKDLVRRGLRCVGPTIIYSFMQVAGITNDHLISCYRFEECLNSAREVHGTNVLKEKAVEERTFQDGVDTEVGPMNGVMKCVEGLSIVS
ncbi:hypothetical protein QJS04_geneDACA013688 [Acorus gramineus]|uniref:Uncharacterized protein n=1 Tax=Acorus gramineus TaxID=55184 RepID=A0AAV9AXT4_ACOGR|nr:hypothetical protein QJS04_geneDACA013688 [Acorus gramineus]